MPSPRKTSRCARNWVVSRPERRRNCRKRGVPGAVTPCCTFGKAQVRWSEPGRERIDQSLLKTRKAGLEVRPFHTFHTNTHLRSKRATRHEDTRSPVPSESPVLGRG